MTLMCSDCADGRVTAEMLNHCVFTEDIGMCETHLFCFCCFSLQPLNPNPDSRWNTYFKDNEVLLQIDKDVRCVRHNHSDSEPGRFGQQIVL